MEHKGREAEEDEAEGDEAEEDEAEAEELRDEEDEGASTSGSSRRTMMVHNGSGTGKSCGGWRTRGNPGIAQPHAAQHRWARRGGGRQVGAVQSVSQSAVERSGLNRKDEEEDEGRLEHIRAEPDERMNGSGRMMMRLTSSVGQTGYFRSSSSSPSVIFPIHPNFWETILSHSDRAKLWRSPSRRFAR